MSDDDPPKPKKPFLRKGQGKSLSNRVIEKKPFLKKGEGKLACFANENDKSSLQRKNSMLIEKSKAEIEMILERRKSEALFSKNDIVQNKPTFIQNIRNNKKKKNEFLDTIEQRIQNLENLHKDKFNYTF
tara:strand:+ start:286 stop:675 length:390 start_codon:yes stop_codon:yes gene_type:complete